MVKIIKTNENVVYLDLFPEIYELCNKCNDDNIEMKLEVTPSYCAEDKEKFERINLNFSCIINKSLITDELEDLLKQICKGDRRGCYYDIIRITEDYIRKGYYITKKADIYDDLKDLCDKYNLDFPENNDEITLYHQEITLREKTFFTEKPEESSDILSIEEGSEELTRLTNNKRVNFRTTIKDIPRNREVILKIFEFLSK